LPFPNNTFDFAYGINVIHHILDSAERERSLAEIVRILKPRGVFFLHEINTRNPLFAFYMSYLFPVLANIDEGDEIWIRPDSLPTISGALWAESVDYFTFLPDFIPVRLVQRLEGMESFLEHSRMRVWSAHYLARMVKKGLE
jgi:SAM-dependent methyltransferase